MDEILIAEITSMNPNITLISFCLLKYKDCIKKEYYTVYTDLEKAERLVTSMCGYSMIEHVLLGLKFELRRQDIDKHRDYLFETCKEKNIKCFNDTFMKNNKEN